MREAIDTERLACRIPKFDGFGVVRNWRAANVGIAATKPISSLLVPTDTPLPT